MGERQQGGPSQAKRRIKCTEVSLAGPFLIKSGGDGKVIGCGLFQHSANGGI